MKLIKSDIGKINEAVVASICYTVTGQALNGHVKMLVEYLKLNENGIIVPSSNDVEGICKTVGISLSNYNSIRGRLVKEGMITTNGKQIKLHPILASIGYVQDGFSYKVKE